MDWQEAVEIGKAHYAARGVPISDDPYDVYTDGQVFILSQVLPIDDDVIITVNPLTRAVEEITYPVGGPNPFPNAKPITEDSDDETVLEAA